MDARYQPAYSRGEASQVLGVPRSTIGFWMRPESGIIRPDGPRLSFLNLVELYVAGSLGRVHGLPAARIRQAVQYLSQELGLERPLLHCDRLLTDRRDLFLQMPDGLLNASRRGQKAMPEILAPFLERIEYAPDRLPSRLFPVPLKRGLRPEDVKAAPRLIEINPLVCFGRPVLCGLGVPVDEINARWKAGDSINDLSRAFEIDEAKIEAALRLAA